MFRIPPPYLWTPLSPQRVKGCSPLTIPKMRSKPKNASRFAKRIFLCFSHLRLRRRFHVSAGHYRQQRGNTSCKAANRRNEKKVQQRRPPPVAETGRSCWGRGQQDASDSEADAGSRNPGSVTEGDGEGKPFTIKPLHSDKQTFCQSDTIVALPILCQHPCPLRRSAPALPKGEPFIWKKRQTRICLFFHALIALLSPSFSA